MAAAAGPRVKNPLPDVVAERDCSGIAGASAVAYITFSPDGSYQYSTGPTGESTGAFLEDVAPGVASGLYLRMTQTGGVAPSGITSGTWYQLNTDRSWSVFAGVGTARFAAGTYDIASAPAASSIIRTGNWSMTAQGGYASGGGGPL